MHRNWLTGTALVAVLAATPALAQQEAGSLRFADETELQARVGEIDTDGDGSITREEYEAYLDEQGVQEQERESLLVDFDTIDANADAIVVVAELEQVMTIPAGQAQGGQQQAGTATGAATAAQVEVQQATPDVNVQQPAPTVRVDQADPTVRVAQPEPEVAVTQQQPQVEVRQPEPQVQVQQPEPTVQVEQPEAQVAVQQPQPQVAIDAPAPEVEVRQAQPQVQVEQRQPEVRVQQPEPEVNVETAEANVEVQSEEPEVVIEQAEPEVIIEKVTEAEPEAMTEREPAETDVAVAQTQRDTEVAVAPTQTEVAGGIPFQDLEGEAVYNNAGEEFGDIAEFVMHRETGEIYAVVSAGGFLGLIGDSEIVFPYSAISMDGDRVIIDTNLTEDTLEEREDYDEALYTVVPDDRIVR